MLQLFFNQQDSKKQLINPFRNPMKGNIYVCFLHLCTGPGNVLLCSRSSTIPNGLVELADSNKLYFVIFCRCCAGY